MFYKNTFECLIPFVENYNELKEELLSIINLPEQPLNKNTWGVERPYYLNKDENSNATWKTFVFKFFNIKHIPNLNSCPKMNEILSLPSSAGIATAEFSLLKANTKILPHRGYTDILYRAHLPFIVPAGDLGIRVGNEKRKWEEKKWIVFNDKVEHEAWNYSNEDRVVLLIDFNPTPSKSSTQSICKDILSETNDQFLLNIAERKEWLNWLENNQFPLTI